MRVCLPTLCIPEPTTAAAAAAAATEEEGGPGDSSFVGLMWGAVIDGGSEVARELIAPGHYATGAASVRFA